MTPHRACPYLVINTGTDYTDWHSLFSRGWMKLTFCFLSLLFHAWVGITVFTDY